MLRTTIQIIDRIVNSVIIIFCIVLLLYGGYALWDSEHINEQADASLYKTYKPNDKLSFAELQKINPEVFGWLTINDTHIDYPLVQGEDNSKYVNTDVKGNFSLSGSLFLDSRNKKDFSDVNSIIYGHHMDKEAFFGELEYFQNQEYFENHKYGQLYYKEQWHNIEFFAFLNVDAYDNVIYTPNKYEENSRLSYLSYIKNNAQHFRELPFKSEDRYVVLSTCTSSSTNGRHILVGRILEQAKTINTEEK